MTGQHRGTVLVTWLDFDVSDPRTGRALAEAGYELRHAPKMGARSPEQLAALLDGVVAAIVSTDPFTAPVFDAAPKLRVVARVGVGTDSIDVPAATRAGVAVTVTRGVNAEVVADHTLALMLAALRRVVEHDQGVKRGAWSRGGDMLGWQLHGATVGLIGYGEIGRAVARRLAGFGVEVLVHDPYQVEDDVAVVDLDVLLRASQVVSVHAPLNASTRAMLGRREFGLMRRDAVLVNTSRGGLVDEVALSDALSDRTIRAAGLDVFQEEPPAPQPWWRDNVVLSPHVGGVSERSVAEMLEIAVQSVLDVLGGHPSEAVVNPPVLR